MAGLARISSCDETVAPVCRHPGGSIVKLAFRAAALFLALTATLSGALQSDAKDAPRPVVDVYWSTRSPTATSPSIGCSSFARSTTSS